MGLSLGDLAFRGIVGEPVWGPVEHRRLEQQYFGQNGATEIDGGNGGQTIQITWWIDDSFASNSDLRTYLRSVARQQGKHDTLVYTGASSFTLPKTTFDKMEIKRGPLSPTGTATGWWAEAILTFRSLDA